MIIFKLWFFNLSELDQDIHKHAIQKKLKFVAFWKRLLGEKEKTQI